MATGSGWQQQYYCPPGQGKFTSSSATSVPFQSGIAMEYTQDLHLKMSKKIAQLTKVSTLKSGACLPACLPSHSRRAARTEPLASDPRARPVASLREKSRRTPFAIRPVVDILAPFSTLSVYRKYILRSIKFKAHFVVIGVILKEKYACFGRCEGELLLAWKSGVFFDRKDELNNVR